MKAWKVICRKAHVMLPDANFLSPWCQSQSPRAQNRYFCALFSFGTPDSGLFEHKIEVFVRFYPSEALFSGISSTKSRFLCAFGGWNPCFQAFRAQNRVFCALFSKRLGDDRSIYAITWPSCGCLLIPVAIFASCRNIHFPAQ